MATRSVQQTPFSCFPNSFRTSFSLCLYTPIRLNTLPQVSTLHLTDTYDMRRPNVNEPNQYRPTINYYQYIYICKVNMYVYHIPTTQTTYTYIIYEFSPFTKKTVSFNAMKCSRICICIVSLPNTRYTTAPLITPIPSTPCQCTRAAVIMAFISYSKPYTHSVVYMYIWRFYESSHAPSFHSQRGHTPRCVLRRRNSSSSVHYCALLEDFFCVWFFLYPHV